MEIDELVVLFVGALIAVGGVVSLLFSFPLSRAFRRYTDFALGPRPPDGGDHTRADARRVLWRGLRWWVMFWVVAAVAIMCLAIFCDHHRIDREAFERLPGAFVVMLLFYWPFPYMLAACLFEAPRSRRRGTLFVWTHLAGLASGALALAALGIGLHTVFQFTNFRLPGRYNPVSPDPYQMVIYATGLGLVLVYICGCRFRRRIDSARAASVPAGGDTVSDSSGEDPPGRQEPDEINKSADKADP